MSQVVKTTAEHPKPQFGYLILEKPEQHKFGVERSRWVPNGPLLASCKVIYQFLMSRVQWCGVRDLGIMHVCRVSPLGTDSLWHFYLPAWELSGMLRPVEGDTLRRVGDHRTKLDHYWYKGMPMRRWLVALFELMRLMDLDWRSWKHRERACNDKEVWSYAGTVPRARPVFRGEGMCGRYPEQMIDLFHLEFDVEAIVQAHVVGHCKDGRGVNGIETDDIVVLDSNETVYVEEGVNHPDLVAIVLENSNDEETRSHSVGRGDQAV